MPEPNPLLMRTKRHTEDGTGKTDLTMGKDGKRVMIRMRMRMMTRIKAKRERRRRMGMMRQGMERRASRARSRVWRMMRCRKLWISSKRFGWQRDDEDGLFKSRVFCPEDDDHRVPNEASLPS